MHDSESIQLRKSEQAMQVSVLQHSELTCWPEVAFADIGTGQSTANRSEVMSETLSENSEKVLFVSGYF